MPDRPVSRIPHISPAYCASDAGVRWARRWYKRVRTIANSEKFTTLTANASAAATRVHRPRNSNNSGSELAMDGAPQNPMARINHVNVLVTTHAETRPNGERCENEPVGTGRAPGTLAQGLSRMDLLEYHQRPGKRPAGDGAGQQEREPDTDQPNQARSDPELRGVDLEVVVDVVCAQQSQVHDARRGRERQHAEHDTKHHVTRQTKDIQRVGRAEPQCAAPVEGDTLRLTNAHRHQARSLNGRDRDDQ